LARLNISPVKHLDIIRIIHNCQLISSYTLVGYLNISYVFFGDTDMPNIGIPTNNHFGVPGILWYHES